MYPEVGSNHCHLHVKEIRYHYAIGAFFAGQVGLEPTSFCLTGRSFTQLLLPTLFALPVGFEPTTLWLTVRCSNQLSYRRMLYRGRDSNSHVLSDTGFLDRRVYHYTTSAFICSSYWIRTSIFALEERRPVQLNEGAIFFLSVGWDLNPRRDFSPSVSD